MFCLGCPVVEGMNQRKTIACELLRRAERFNQGHCWSCLRLACRLGTFCCFLWCMLSILFARACAGMHLPLHMRPTD